MAGLLVVSVLAVGVPGAVAAGLEGWSAPVRISASGETTATYLDVKNNARGDATALWVQQPNSDAQILTAAERPSGSREWSAPQTLSPPGTAAEYPQLAVTPSGEAVAIWQAWQATGLRFTTAAFILASVRPASSASWSTPVQISPANEYEVNPSLAIDAHGEATAEWLAPVGKIAAPEVATLDPRTGKWSQPHRLPTATGAGPAQVAMDARGDAMVAWSEAFHGGVLSRSGQTAQVVAAVRPAGSASWRRPFPVGHEAIVRGEAIGTLEPVGPQVALDARGDAIIAWQTGSPEHPMIAVRVRIAATGRWDRPQAISRPGSDFPAVAVTPGGDATVVWSQTTKKGLGVQASSGELDGCCWTRPATLTANPDAPAYLPRLAVDRFGDAVVTWTSDTEQIDVRRGPLGRWLAPVSLGLDSLGGGGSAITTDAQGNTVVIWTRDHYARHIYNGFVVTTARRIR